MTQPRECPTCGVDMDTTPHRKPSEGPTLSEHGASAFCACYYCNQIRADLTEIISCLHQEFYKRAEIVAGRLRQRLHKMHAQPLGQQLIDYRSCPVVGCWIVGEHSHDSGEREKQAEP